MILSKGVVSFGFEGLLFIGLQVLGLAIFLLFKETWLQIVLYMVSLVVFVIVVVKY